MAGITVVSVVGALILLPVIGLKVLATALPLAKKAGCDVEPAGHYLIT